MHKQNRWSLKTSASGGRVFRFVFIRLTVASAHDLYLRGGIITYIGTQIAGGLLRSSHLVMALDVLAFTAIHHLLGDLVWR
jgi:hypothetical protein